MEQTCSGLWNKQDRHMYSGTNMLWAVEQTGETHVQWNKHALGCGTNRKDACTAEQTCSRLQNKQKKCMYSGINMLWATEQTGETHVQWNKHDLGCGKVGYMHSGICPGLWNACTVEETHSVLLDRHIHVWWCKYVLGCRTVRHMINGGTKRQDTCRTDILVL